MKLQTKEFYNILFIFINIQQTFFCSSLNIKNKDIFPWKAKKRMAKMCRDKSKDASERKQQEMIVIIDLSNGKKATQKQHS